MACKIKHPEADNIAGKEAAARGHAQVQLSPQTITDRDVVIALDDETVVMHWGVVFHGLQYVTLFGQWFDELWTNLPDAHLLYSRRGLNQSAIDMVKKELEGAAASDRATN
ncbi:MAG: hypothetical protein ACREQT_05315 [Candidatus Binataceae bacterium]